MMLMFLCLEVRASWMLHWHLCREHESAIWISTWNRKQCLNSWHFNRQHLFKTLKLWVKSNNVAPCSLILNANIITIHDTHTNTHTHIHTFPTIHIYTNSAPIIGGLEEGEVNDSALCAHQFNSTRSRGRKSFEEVPQSLQTEAASFSVICYHVACLFTVSTNSS